MGLVVVGGVLLLASRGRGPAATQTTTRPPISPLDDQHGTIADLKVDVLNPLSKKPGDIMTVGRVSFRYRGPAQTLWLGWGVKPGHLGGFLPGTEVDFDNGENLIARPVRAWNWAKLRSVPTTAKFVNVVHDYAALNRAPNPKYDIPDVGGVPVTIPNPAVKQYAADGTEQRLNFGDTDIWIWITGSLRQPTLPTALTITVEDDMLAFEKGANAFDIVRPLEEEAEDLTFSFL